MLRSPFPASRGSTAKQTVGARSAPEATPSSLPVCTLTRTLLADIKGRVQGHKRGQKQQLNITVRLTTGKVLAACHTTRGFSSAANVPAFENESSTLERYYTYKVPALHKNKNRDTGPA